MQSKGRIEAQVWKEKKNVLESYASRRQSLIAAFVYKNDELLFSTLFLFFQLSDHIAKTSLS